MFSQQIDDNIRLELLESAHTGEFFRLTDENREYLSKWLPWVDSVREPEDTAEFIRNCQKQWIDNRGYQAAIRVNENLAGVIGHHKIDWLNRNTSLGYWLAEPYQGRGVMTRCCLEVVRHSFSEFNLHRVEIRCASNNYRSCAIPERLKFEIEGTLREAAQLNGRFVDLIVYGALSGKWNYPEMG